MADGLSKCRSPVAGGFPYAAAGGACAWGLWQLQGCTARTIMPDNPLTSLRRVGSPAACLHGLFRRGAARSKQQDGQQRDQGCLGAQHGHEHGGSRGGLPGLKGRKDKCTVCSSSCVGAASYCLIRNMPWTQSNALLSSLAWSSSSAAARSAPEGPNVPHFQPSNLQIPASHYGSRRKRPSAAARRTPLAAAEDRQQPGPRTPSDAAACSV